MSDSNWFSQAGSLDDSLDNSNNPSELTTDEHTLISKDQIDPQKHKSSGSAYIKPVKGLKDVSPVAKNTRTYSTRVKSGASINGKPKNKNGKSNKASFGNSFFAKNKKTIIAVAICLLIAGAIILFLNKYKHNNRNSTTENNSAITSDSTIENHNNGQNDTEYSVEYPDVEKYFNENSTVVSVDSISDSKNILAESEVYQLLVDRGFTGYSITSEYSMNGEYLDQTEISPSSSTKHPTYQTYYVNSSGELWLIMVIERQVMATPISYTLEHPDLTTVLLAESNEITSYDSSSTKFYRTIPNKSVMDVRIYDQIDAALLDSLTSEDLTDE